MLRSTRRSWRESVVLPAPEGDDRTNIIPLRFTPSLQIRDLLAELLDHGLELKPDIGELHVGCLGAQRIRFAIELLRKKIEPTADRGTLAEKLLGLRNVGGEAVKLLADIGLGGEQNGFLVQ